MRNGKEHDETRPSPYKTASQDINRKPNTRFLLAALAINLVLAAVLVALRYDAVELQAARGVSRTLDSGWTVSLDSEVQDEQSLPIRVKGNDAPMLLQYALDDSFAGQTLSLGLLNAAVRVYINDSVCYEDAYLSDGDSGNAAPALPDSNTGVSPFAGGVLPIPTQAMAESTIFANLNGSEILITLPEDLNGATLTLMLEPVDANQHYGLASAVVSRSDTFYNTAFRRGVVSFFCTILICSNILVVFVIHFVGVCSRRRGRAHLVCTLFGIFLALHISSQISVLQSVYGNRHLFLWSSVLSLTFLPPLLVGFYRELLGDGPGDRLLHFLLNVGSVLGLGCSVSLLFLNNFGLRYVRGVVFTMLAVSAFAVLVVFFIRGLFRSATARVRMISLLLLLFTIGHESYCQYASNSSLGLSSYWAIGLTLCYTITSVIGVITEIAAHTAVIRASEQKAVAANKAKSAFLANMSHEIRTPINAILGMDEIILRESTEEETLDCAEDIQNAGKTLLSLVNDILDFSKIEEGKMEILPIQYDLSSVVNDLVNMVRGRAENKGLHFEVRVDENIPHLLYGDEIRIRQCALNVLTNAVKYTQSGSVTLEVGFEPSDDEAILLRFRVTDTGIGMKPEDIDKLFSPFTRIEEKRNRSVEGTGLGMSITKQLLALMDSHLEVQSVYGEGSTFTFAVRQTVVDRTPVGKFSGRYQADGGRQVYHELFHAPQARILVVDDTVVNLSVVKGLLKRTQLVVDTAESGAEALVKAAQNHYDAIFIDHMMPDMDGMETLRELRKRPELKEVPCIALTANAISGSREMYLNAGFTDYLAKPVDGKKLERMLMSCLPPEKLLKPEPTAEDASSPSPAALPDWLYAVDGLDVASGIRHCGTEDTYLDTLTIYAKNAAGNADEIEHFWNAGDVANTVVKVHALKSTSRAVGAEDLGALAEKLELAGKAGDTATLGAELDDLLARFRALAQSLAPLHATEQVSEDMPDATDEQLREAYDTLREFAANLDTDGAVFVLDRLDGFRLPEAERARCSALRRAVEGFAWEQIDDILNQ